MSGNCLHTGGSVGGDKFWESLAKKHHMLYKSIISMDAKIPGLNYLFLRVTIHHSGELISLIPEEIELCQLVWNLLPNIRT